MSWHCRLYGHQWRHPGEYEVLLVDDRVPAYPFQCAVCETEVLRDANGSELHPETISTTPEPELESEAEPELESETDPELDAGGELEGE